MKIVENQSNLKEPESKPVEVKPVVQEHKQIDFNQVEKPVEKKSVFAPQLKSTLLPPIGTTKKQKGWWIFKAPILIYLLASFGYVWLSGTAISTYMVNPMAVYALLGLHVVIVMMFILLCVMTKVKKE